LNSAPLFRMHFALFAAEGYNPTLGTLAHARIKDSSVLSSPARRGEWYVPGAHMGLIELLAPKERSPANGASEEFSAFS
jgi:hypothetical protein